jgi:LysR family transcriptional activator of mexEF-oprN operon
VCLFDPAHAPLGTRPTRAQYLAADHVIVSYEGSLRGLVEEKFGVERRVRISVPTVHSIGAMVDGSALVATLPDIVARQMRAPRPHLRIVPAPFGTPAGATMNLLSRRALADDGAVAFVAERIVAVVKRLVSSARPGSAASSASSARRPPARRASARGTSPRSGG